MTLRSRFFAMTYDHQMTKVEKAGLRVYREQLLAGVAGRVLEIGAGTGSNLRFYGPAVESLTLTEPEIPMLRRLERKAAELTRRERSAMTARPWTADGDRRQLTPEDEVIAS